MKRGALPLALTLGALGALAAAAGCGGKSIVIGGDQSGAAGEFATGGATTGGAPTGGSDFVTGGVFPTGGASVTGGAFPTGGSDFVTGGTFPSGGTATGAYGGTDTGVNGGSSTIPTGGTNGITGGDGGVVDAYPIVFWEDGEGYRRSCPMWGDVWGFTCWSAPQDGAVGACSLDGQPYCNACSCAVPCETSEDCPAALTGQRAACLSSATNVPSCFVLCEVRTHCPTGMQCEIHPGSGISVCVWVSDRVE